MITLQCLRTVPHTVELTEGEAKEVVERYVRGFIMKGMYLNKEGMLESWEDTHGSGITTQHGFPSKLQKAACKFIDLLEKQ